MWFGSRMRCVFMFCDFTSPTICGLHAPFQNNHRRGELLFITGMYLVVNEQTLFINSLSDSEPQIHFMGWDAFRFCRFGGRKVHWCQKWDRIVETIHSTPPIFRTNCLRWTQWECEPMSKSTLLDCDDHNRKCARLRNSDPQEAPVVKRREIIISSSRLSNRLMTCCIVAA